MERREFLFSHWSGQTNPYTSGCQHQTGVPLRTTVSSKGVSIVWSLNALQIPATALTRILSFEGCRATTLSLLPLNTEGHFFQTFPLEKGISRKSMPLWKIRVLSLKIFHSSDNSHSAFLLKAVGQWPCHCSHFPLKVISFKLSLALLELIMQGELNRKNTNLGQKWVLSANIFHSSISGSHHPFPLKAVGRWPCQWFCSTMWMESTPLKVISYKCSFPS